MLKKIVLISIVISINFLVPIFANEYKINNDNGDSDLTSEFNGKSKIFNLDIKKDAKDIVIDGNFNLLSVYDNNLIIQNSMPLSISKDIVKKLKLGDIIIFDIYKSKRDSRLDDKKSFKVVDKFRFEKPKLISPTENEKENMDLFLGQEFPYDKIDVLKLKDNNSNIYYYIPCANEKNIKIYYDREYKNYDIGTDFNIKYTDDIEFYIIKPMSKYENGKTVKWEEYVKVNMDIKQFEKKLANIKKLRFNNKNELIAIYYNEVVIGGING